MCVRTCVRGDGLIRFLPGICARELVGKNVDITFSE